MLRVPSYGLLGEASAARSVRAVRLRWFWVELFGGGRFYPGSASSWGRACACRVCARSGCVRAGLANSVTLSELGERRAGGAGRPGRSGAVRRAAPPGLGRPRPSARLYGQELAAAAHSGAGAWWVGAGTALAPFQPVRGSGEGPCLQKAQAAASQTPLPARPWSLRLSTPRKVWLHRGFHGKLGLEGGGPWT